MDRGDSGSAAQKWQGLLRAYVARMTGLSQAQIMRVNTSYATTGRVKSVAYNHGTFSAPTSPWQNAEDTACLRARLSRCNAL